MRRRAVLSAATLPIAAAAPLAGAHPGADPHVEWLQVFLADKQRIREACARWQSIRDSRDSTEAEDDELEIVCAAAEDESWALAIAASETPAFTVAGALAQLRIWVELNAEAADQSRWSQPWDIRAFRLGLATLDRLSRGASA